MWLARRPCSAMPLVRYGSLQMVSRSSSRSLKQLSRRPIRAKDIVIMLEDYADMTDQATALVLCTAVERSLERSILSRMVRMNRKHRLDLFEGLGPIATMSAKIKIAASLGIIGPSVISDLESIKNIRNQFAHSFHPLSFDTKSVATKCKLLQTAQKLLKTPSNRDRDLGTNPRDLYAYSCWGIWTALRVKAVAGPRPKRSRHSISRMLLR